MGIAFLTILVTVICNVCLKMGTPKENHQFSGKWTVLYILKLSYHDVTRTKPLFLLEPLDFLFANFVANYFIKIFKEVKRLSAAA